MVTFSQRAGHRISWKRRRNRRIYFKNQPPAESIPDMLSAIDSGSRHQYLLLSSAGVTWKLSATATVPGWHIDKPADMWRLVLSRPGVRDVRRTVSDIGLRQGLLDMQSAAMSGRRHGR